MRTERSIADLPLAPLHVLTGAPGAGKSTVLPELIRLGNGLIVTDIDELLEDGNLLGVPIAHPGAEPNWPAYDRLWQRITAIPRRSGHPVLFLCPNTPDELPWASSWLLLDCSDDTRAARLRARGWDRARIDEALSDAAECRAQVTDAVLTDCHSPVHVAGQVLTWVRQQPYSQPSN